MSAKIKLSYTHPVAVAGIIIPKIKDDVKRGLTGRGYKITKTKQGYWLALFHEHEVVAFDGWNNRLLRHAKGDGENFIHWGV